MLRAVCSKSHNGKVYFTLLACCKRKHKVYLKASRCLLYFAKRLKSKNTAKKALIYDLAGVGRLEAQQTRTANKNIFMQFSSLRLVWLWCRFILHCRGFLLHVRWACLRGFNSTRERLNGRLDCEDVINSGFVGEKSEMFIGNLSGLLFFLSPLRNNCNQKRNKNATFRMHFAQHRRLLASVS